MRQQAGRMERNEVMQDVFTRWPHATPAEIYAMFPPEGATPRQIVAGSAVIEVIDAFSRSHRTGGYRPGEASRGSVFGLNMEWHNGDAIHVDGRRIYRMPTLIKDILAAAYPNHSENLLPDDPLVDPEDLAPYHGPLLARAIYHPFLRGAIGLTSREDWAVLQWHTMEHALDKAGAPHPSVEASARIMQAFERHRPDLSDHIEHTRKWLGSGPNNYFDVVLRKLIPHVGQENGELFVMGLIAFTDDIPEGQSGRGSMQTRLRFLNHFPTAWILFEPYAPIGDELTALRRAIDTHHGNMLDDLSGLVGKHLSRPADFRKNPMGYIGKAIERGIAAEARQRADAKEEQRLEDERDLHALRTFGAERYYDMIARGEELPDIFDEDGSAAAPRGSS
ncbi:hypothetical protein [Defluviimonas salinarum]|uniref:Uncharacterized protein n=1 Tax=Defluviimonas salinarum TaxID=2992147 RepID=A0ABT3J937_9RHOB|nr:hypothetical protein [Defluviimonas salinarum]MCW3784181.1 hypothetical protein [Defluviimonas salinarum]